MKDRPKQVASLIHSEVSMSLMLESPTDKLGLLTVSEVTVTPDMEQADVYVSSSNKDLADNTIAKHLSRVRGKIQLALGKKMESKKTPKIRFHVDSTSGEFEHLEEILSQIHDEQQNKE